MKNLMLSTAAAVALTGAAHAGLSEVQSLNFSFPLSPGDATLTFDQFDDQGGTRVLKEVRLFLDGFIQASVTAENDSTLPAPDFALNLSGNMSVTFGNLSGTGLFNETFNTDGSVGPSDGNPGSGPDFWDFGTVSDSATDDDDTTTDLAQYIGGGTIDADIVASGGFSVSGSTDSTLVITDFGASGSVTIEYIYNIIPAPAGLAIFGAAGLAGTRRRRG